MLLAKQLEFAQQIIIIYGKSSIKIIESTKFFRLFLITFLCSCTKSKKNSSYEGESESSSHTSLSIPWAIRQVFDDDPILVRVVNFLFDSSLELVLDSSPPLTHSPKMANDSCLGFFSFFYCFFLNLFSTFMS